MYRIGLMINPIITFVKICVISEASAAGTADDYWAVGDTKSIVINGNVVGFGITNLTVNVFILGFNHNASREGSNRIHFQIGKIGATPVALCDSQYGSSGSSQGFRMNTSNTNNGGWASSYMRNTVLGNGGTPSSPNQEHRQCGQRYRQCSKQCDFYPRLSFLAGGI